MESVEKDDLYAWLSSLIFLLIAFSIQKNTLCCHKNETGPVFWLRKVFDMSQYST